MKNAYSQKIVVDDTSIDFKYEMPIYDIIRIIQTATFNHSDLIGLDHETMEKTSNAFWVVTKIKLMLNSAITRQEKLTIKTWTQEPNLVRFKRDFTVKQQSKVKVKGSTEWCCLDMDTHKIRKASSINYPQLEMVETSNINTEYTNLRPELDKKDFVYTYTVRSTDIDVNMHTNNLKYNFMALNAFTVEQLGKMEIKEYELYFVNESHEGDNIDIYKKKIKNYYYIEGKTADKVVFRTVIKFKSKK